MPHQSRIACLRIPGFQIAAHQKAEPALKGKTLVIVAGTGARAKVLHCSTKASAKHLWPGMKLSEAKAVVADLTWREASPELYDQTQKELMTQLVSCSPRVTPVEPGLVLLDASGLAHLGGEEQFCRNLQKTVTAFGFTDPHVGIADSAFCALVASRYKNRRHFLVPQNEGRQFLQALSIRHLPYAELCESLLQLGIKTMGQFVALPIQEVEERFGSVGLEAYQLCLGNDYVRPVQVPEEKTYSTQVELGFPVESMDQCRFIFKSMLEELTLKLKENDLAAESLFIEFFNDNDKIDERILSLIQPSTSAKFLLELVRLSIESQPLAREFTRASITVSRFQSQKWTQHSLEVVENSQKNVPEQTHLVAEINSSGNEPLLLLLQRLMGKLGNDSVVQPVPADQHLPDLAGAWLPVEETLQSNKSTDDIVLPLSLEAMNFPGKEALACGLVLKRSPESESVLVKYEGDLPRAITYRGRWYRIVEMSEPEKLSGLWWENPVNKSYFVTLIEPCEETDRIGKHTNAVYVESGPARAHKLSPEKRTQLQMSYLVLLVQDHLCGSWQIDGFFD